MNLLIIRLSALGDVAMTVLPVVAYAKEHSGHQVKVLTHRRFEVLFGGRAANLSTIGYDPARHKGLRGTLRLLRLLQKERIDRVVDLHNVLRSWVIDGWFMLHGKPVSMVSKHRSERKAVINHRKTATPFTRRYAGIMGVEACSSINPGNPITHNRAAHPLTIGIAPFARYTNKVYPLDLMEQVVARLSAEEGARIIFFGGGDKELAVFRQWIAKYPRVETHAGETDLAGELQLMSRLDVMISMDSANQHLASLAGTRVITLWGSTTPACGFAPWGQPPNDGIAANLGCQPCTIAGSNLCKRGDMACMRSISPDDIVRKILS